MRTIGVMVLAVGCSVAHGQFGRAPNQVITTKARTISGVAFAGTQTLAIVGEAGRGSRVELHRVPKAEQHAAKASYRLVTGFGALRAEGIAITPDGKRIVVHSREVIEVFSAAGRRQARFSPPSHKIPVKGVEQPKPVVRQIAIAPDGKTLAVHAGWAVCLYRLPGKRPRKTLERLSPLGIAFLPTGELLIGESNGRLHVIDARSGRTRRMFPLHATRPARMRGVIPAAGPKSIATADGSSISLFDPRQGRLVRTLRLPRRWQRGIALSGDGGLVSYFENSFSPVVLDAVTGAELLRPWSPWKGVCLAWAAQGRILAVGSVKDGQVGIWNLRR